MSLGQRVYDLRKLRGLSTRALAEAAGISCGQVTAIEVGRATNPRLSTLVGLSRALDVSIGELVDEI